MELYKYRFKYKIKINNFIYLWNFLNFLQKNNFAKKYGNLKTNLMIISKKSHPLNMP